MHVGGMQPESSPTPVNRIVLLGASNLTLSLFRVIEGIQRICGSPSTVLVAAGHGRSYGRYSRVLFRGLPGIVDCDLWADLSRARKLPTYGFFTDIGNDIPYGYSPDQIDGWLRFCVEHLLNCQAQIVISDLALEVYDSLSRLHFAAMRRIFFPFSRLTMPEALVRIHRVSQQLHRLAAERGVIVCEQDRDWYGFDPIHIRRRCKAEAYGRMLGHFSGSGNSVTGSRAKHGRLGWRNRPRPKRRDVFGWELRHDQPSSVLADGTTISMY